jgi:hypothetical protein
MLPLVSYELKLGLFICYPLQDFGRIVLIRISKSVNDIRVKFLYPSIPFWDSMCAKTGTIIHRTLSLVVFFSWTICGVHMWKQIHLLLKMTFSHRKPKIIGSWLCSALSPKCALSDQMSQSRAREIPRCHITLLSSVRMHNHRSGSISNPAKHYEGGNGNNFRRIVKL